ncbi:hypothetical protein [Pediococcus pentosaceus]|nr:hypothetical protein [Pediococcus pentosaceus]
MNNAVDGTIESILSLQAQKPLVARHWWTYQINPRKSSWSIMCGH